MNYYIENYFYAFFIFLSIIFSLMLLLKSKGSIAYVILSLNFFIVSVILFLSKITGSESLINYPHLSRILSPLVYLIPPLIYLFHYYLLRPQEKFNYYFLLLSIPFLFQIAEFSSFYFSPIEDKIQEIQRINLRKDFLYYSPKYTWIKPIYHVRLKIVQYMFFWALIAKDLYKYFKGKFLIMPTKGSIISYWLIGIFILRFLSICYFFSSYLFHYVPRRQLNGLEFMLIADSIYLAIFLFFNPSFFYNSFFTHDIQDISVAHTPEVESLHLPTNDLEYKGSDIVENSSQIFKEFSDFLSSTKIYLEKDCTVESISHAMKISQRTLSQVVRIESGLHVKDFINKCRIEFLIAEYVLDPYLRKQSFTLIAELAGFGTRQSLYNACSKLYGAQPKALFDQALMKANSKK